jgi:ankyrin repeat protein
MHEFLRVMTILETGGVSEFEQLAAEVPGFPDGIDSYLGRRWIINAIGCGSGLAVRWMLDLRVDLHFRDDEGYTPLHTAIDRQREDKHELLQALVVAGAPLNLKGINDWTPLHLAAARDDVEALRILVTHGADMSIRTQIDDYATPLEEARILGKLNAVRYFEEVTT